MSEHLLLDSCLHSITALDEQAMAVTQKRLDSLAKPPGSLGHLETIAITLAGIYGAMPSAPSHRAVIIMAADNGVVVEGVASAPQEVTATQTLNFARGITGVAVLARQFRADLILVDVGIASDVSHPAIRQRKIRKGTHNLAKQAAMTRDEALQAINIGIETVSDAASEGYTLLGAGEMGIGNTTSSSAVLAALTGLPVAEVTGFGAGLRREAYAHKIDVIEEALRRHTPDADDPLDVLSKVGGFDIAALAGVYLGAGLHRLPMVVDGFISLVAALVAVRLCPGVRPYLLASHASAEPGFRHAAAELGLTPLLHLDMRLGEGSGCPLMFGLIDAACALLSEMATFEEASITAEYLEALKPR